MKRISMIEKITEESVEKPFYLELGIILWKMKEMSTIEICE